MFNELAKSIMLIGNVAFVFKEVYNNSNNTLLLQEIGLSHNNPFLSLNVKIQPNNQQNIYSSQYLIIIKNETDKIVDVKIDGVFLTSVGLELFSSIKIKNEYNKALETAKHLKKTYASLTISLHLVNHIEGGYINYKLNNLFV
jgi:hypothetical protein